MKLLDSIISKILFCPDKTIKIFPEDYDLESEEIFINLPSNDQLHGLFIPGLTKKDKFIIYLHGSQGNIGLYLKGIKNLHKTGANILIADYRGFGKSTGQALINNTIEDGMHMINYLKEYKGAKDISLFGYSYGGALAVELASREKINAIAIESTFSSLKKISCELYPILGHMLIPSNLLNSLEKIKKLPIPKLIAHAEYDQIVPIKHSEDLYKEAIGSKRLFKIKDARHDDICDFVTDEYIDLVTEVLV